MTKLKSPGAKAGPDSELIEFVCLENQKFDAYLKGQERK